MKEFAQNLIVLMAKGDEPWSSHRFQSACQIPCNSVIGAKMISTSVFLDSVFQACTLTCDCLAVLGKKVCVVCSTSVSKLGLPPGYWVGLVHFQRVFFIGGSVVESHITECLWVVYFISHGKSSTFKGSFAFLVFQANCFHFSSHTKGLCFAGPFISHSNQLSNFTFNTSTKTLHSKN